MMGSSTSSGIVTTAFLVFSSRDPSSVDPFCPQRTYRSWVQMTDITDPSVSGSMAAKWSETLNTRRRDLHNKQCVCL